MWCIHEKLNHHIHIFLQKHLLCHKVTSFTHAHEKSLNILCQSNILYQKFFCSVLDRENKLYPVYDSIFEHNSGINNSFVFLSKK